MTHREPFGLGTVITDYLWFLVRRAHLVVSLMCLQFLISFVLLAILGLFEFQETNNIRRFALAIIALISISMISACAISVSRWRRGGEIGWRTLIVSRSKGILQRAMFAIVALTLIAGIMFVVHYYLGDQSKDIRALLVTFAGFTLLPIATGPLFQRDLHPNPWTAIWPTLRGVHRIAPGIFVFTFLNILIAFLFLFLQYLSIAPSLFSSLLSADTLGEAHSQLLQDARVLLSAQTLFFLQLFAAAFLFERYKEITYGRDLSHVAEAF